MKPDRKFGWHIYWVIPILMVYGCVVHLRERYRVWRHHIYIKKIKRQNPDIAKLSILSGIDKPKKSRK